MLHIKENVDENRCSMTLDLWSDDYLKRNYLTITVHYIDRIWSKVHGRVLCTSHFTMEKTGENILLEVSNFIYLFINGVIGSNI